MVDYFEALAALDVELERAHAEIVGLRACIAVLLRDPDRALSDLVSGTDVSIVVPVAALLADLSRVVTNVRLTQAHVMRGAGVGTDRIARSLGVSRQRASAILHRADDVFADEAGGDSGDT
jgi:hypothetical protein